MASGQTTGARAWVSAWHQGRGGDPRLELWSPHLFVQLCLPAVAQASRSLARWNQQGNRRRQTSESERDLVGCVALSQGALTWEQLTLTPAGPEARDAQSRPACTGHR